MAMKRKYTASTGSGSTKRMMPYKKPRYERKDILSRTAYSSRMLGTSNELKMVDTSNIDGLLASLALTNGVLLNPIGAGDDINQRDGRRVLLHSIQLRGFVYASGNPSQPVVGRLVVVYDRQSNAALPSSATFFNNTAVFSSLNNVNNQGRFLTIFDEMISLDSSTLGGGGRHVQHFNLFKYLKNIPTRFQGNENNIGSIESGSLVGYFFASSNSAASMTIYTRVKYRDT